jgi:hypothetical protein
MNDCMKYVKKESINVIESIYEISFNNCKLMGVYHENRYYCAFPNGAHQ